MASASAEIYDNHEMETACEYLLASLLHLWEGKTEGLVSIRTTRADAPEKHQSAQYCIVFLLPVVLHVLTGDLPACVSQARSCRVAVWTVTGAA